MKLSVALSLSVRLPNLVRSALCSVAVFVLAVCTILSVSGYAYADESSDDSTGNQVYPNQLPDSSFLYETAIADLVEADSYYEGQTVLVQGEVVGDCVNDEFKDSYCWITLQDDEDAPNVIAVYMSKSDSEIIDTYGGYETTGTQIQVTGTYHLECADHQGLSDVHVEQVSAVQEGYENTETVDNTFVVAGAAACVLGAILMGIFCICRERML